jgi:NAD(P)-dependent dehydrogenase (short-subunit alcohol dehydrogenase family)
MKPISFRGVKIAHPVEKEPGAPMKIQDSVALVTGGNRGIGKAFVDELFARGARKVYAAVRNPASVTNARVTPLTLDVTDPESVAAAAALARDVTVLINNAGATSGARFLTSDVDDVRRDFETNFYGPLFVTRAFAPIIEANGGGHILNVHSALSWLGSAGSYSASKAALWSMTNSLRLDLAPKRIVVTGLHVGYVDTDMTANIDSPKSRPEDVVALALDGVEEDAYEVLADEVSRSVKSRLSDDIVAMYPQLATPAAHAAVAGD